MEMLKTASTVFVLMSFIGGVFAMLAYSFQKVDKIIKGRPRLFQKPSFRLLIVWMICFGIFGVFYFTSTQFLTREHYIWYGVSLLLMPVAALMGTGLIRLALSDRIRKINKVYIEIEAREKPKRNAEKTKKKAKGKGKAGEDELYKDYETFTDGKGELFEDDPDLYRLGKDKDKEEYFKDYM